MCTSTVDGGRCRPRDAGSTDASNHDVRFGPLPTDLVGLRIEPANVTLTLEDAARTTVSYTAIAMQRDGRTRTLASGVRFSIDIEAIGTMDGATGVFTPAGVGGLLRVRAATLDGTLLSADTALTVIVRRTVVGMGVGDVVDVRRRFEMAVNAPDEATTRSSVDYPLDRAVMPRNVHPPTVMWTPRHTVAATDVFRVRLARARAVLEAYFLNTAMNRNSWSIPAAEFRTLSDSDVGSNISVTVSVLSGALVRDSAPVSFRTVDGVVAGAVYYWSPPRGRLTRIDVDTANRVDFMPNPQGGCIACHAVSRDGRRLSAITDDGRPLSVFDLTRDLTTNPPPRIFTSAPQTMRTQSFNGDGTRLVTAPHGAGALNAIDATTGAMISPGPVGTGEDPEWSPDSNMTTAGDIAYSQGGNLMMIRTMPGDMFAPARMLHMGSSTPGGSVDWHPTWTPDSNWLIFQHGEGNYTRGAATLFMLPRAGGTPMRLTTLTGAMATNNYRAVASPFNSGGYFWILFTSTRTYGNATAGVAGQKLIWIAAIRNNPTAYCMGRPPEMCDPSEVPYYLDGQEAITNLSPHWAPPPCRPTGSACATGADCCTGNCEPDMAGASVCRPPRGACRMRGSSCSTDSDCCTGNVCTDGHICDQPLG